MEARGLLAQWRSGVRIARLAPAWTEAWCAPDRRIRDRRDHRLCLPGRIDPPGVAARGPSRKEAVKLTKQQAP